MDPPTALRIAERTIAAPNIERTATSYTRYSVPVSILEFNGAATPEDTLDPRGATYVRETLKAISGHLGSSDAVDAKRRLEKLIVSLGLEGRLSGLGICSEEDIEQIVTGGFNPKRVRNNPRLLRGEELREMLYRIR